jgi:hypothetical protein
VIRGVAGQIIGAQMVKAADGSAYTGAVTVYVDGDHTGQVIGSVGAGAGSQQGNGYCEYLPSAAETDYDHIGFTFIGAGAVPVTIQVATVTPAQVSALATATGLASVVVSDLITDAFTEIRAARAGDVLAPEQMAWGLGKLNRLLDRWNANPRASYRGGFASYTLTASHQPHTIGPSAADFTVTARPKAILGANLILTNVSPVVRVPITLRDSEWWLAQSLQGLASSMPTDLYYDAGWPNGSLNLWPVPSTAYDLELLTDGLFDVLALTDAFWMPFGYRDAVTLTLAEEIAPGMGQRVDSSTAASAREARALIFGGNDDMPRIVTRDAGMPGGGGGGFDFRTGFLR